MYSFSFHWAVVLSNILATGYEVVLQMKILILMSFIDFLTDTEYEILCNEEKIEELPAPVFWYCLPGTSSYTQICQNVKYRKVLRFY